jgi:glycosyltransferase involved in cell wall biosynthesis
VKVCILTTGFPRFEGDLYGGFVSSLARALVSKGAEVTAVCPHDPGLALTEEMDGVSVRRFRYTIPSGLERLAYRDGIPVNLKNSFLAKLEVPAFMAAMGLAARRWGRGADVIHAQWAISALAASFANRPLVLTLRGSDLKDNPGRLQHWIASKALRRADKVFTVSQDLLGRAESLCATPGKTVLMPNGVDLDLFAGRERLDARKELGLAPDSRIALFVGQLIPRKNPLVLVEAARALRDVEPRVEFHLVGDGPLAPRLRESAAAAEVADRVTVHGHRPHEQISLWLAASDLLVLPALFEGRPNVVLEAMAASRPVLATRAGGTAELLVDGETGLLVPLENDAAFIAAARKLLETGEVLSPMGQAGRRRIEALGLSWDAVATRHLEIYEEVLSKRGASGT